MDQDNIQGSKGQAASDDNSQPVSTTPVGSQQTAHDDTSAQPVPTSPPPSQGSSQTGDGDSSAQGSQKTQATKEKSFLRPRPPDTELGIGSVADFSTSIQVPPHPNTTFDELYFLKMLSGSISLTKNEKKKIVESVSKLSQYQIDELIKIFEEERRKFAELDEKHQVKIRELQAKQADDWKDLEMLEQQKNKQGEDEAAAAALRNKLLKGDTGSSPQQDQTTE